MAEERKIHGHTAFKVTLWGGVLQLPMRCLPEAKALW